MEQGPHLTRVAEVEAKIAAHDAVTVPSTVDPASLATLAADLKSVLSAPTTDARLKKRIVRHMLRHSTGYKLANDGHDTRSLAHYLGHRNLQSTARYTALAPDRFARFWQD
jgi:site-specific recombinase XerD